MQSPDMPRPAATRSQQTLALVVICAAQLMIVLDATVVNVALPTIHTGLHFATSDLQWLLTSYSLTFGGLLLLGGRTGDLYGRRRMFLIGVTVFAAASLLGGLATDPGWLIATRAAQGVGAAIAAPTALSLIATTFPEGSARSRALAAYAVMSAGGGAVGLLLGGLLTDLLSWRWVFFINVPIAVAVLVLAPRVIPAAPRSDARLDLPGALTATVGTASLVYGLSNSPQHGWTAVGTIVPLVAAAVLLAAFIVIERRGTDTLVPPRLVADRNRAGAYVLSLSIGATVLSTLYFLTLFLQNIQHWSALRTGLGFLPVTLGVLVGSVVTSRIVTRSGVRVPLLLGPLFTVGSMIWLTRLSVSDGYSHVLGPLLLMALGVGFEFVPITVIAVRGVAARETGAASALVNTSQQIGGALGLSVLATVASSAATTRSHALAGTVHNPIALANAAATHGYTTAFTVTAGLAAFTFLVSAFAFRATPAAPAVAGSDDAGSSTAAGAGVADTSVTAP